MAQDNPIPKPPSKAPDKGKDLQETMYYVGLKTDAPMEVVDIPTLAGYKAVSVPKFTKELHADDANPHVMVLGGKVAGRHEALMPVEFEAFMKYIRGHAFFIERTSDVEVPIPGTNKTETKTVKSGFVVSTKEDAGDIQRSPRDKAKKMEALADYVWIVPASDRSRYPGRPPTITEMDENGGA